MRPRQRYLAIRIRTSGPAPSESLFRNAVWHQLQELYGELGVSRIGFWLITYHQKAGVAILRCQHDQVPSMRAALTTMTSCNSAPLLLYVVGISGTLRKAVSLLPELDARNVIRPRKHR